MQSILQIKPSFGKEESDAVAEYILSGGWLTEFEKTKEFEQKIVEFLGVKHCFAVPSGTMALTIACMALDIGWGDEVLVPAITMVATANAPLMLDTEVRLVEINSSGCMDLTDTLDSISLNTKAIIYVSLNGRAEDLDILQLECKRKGIYLIEDACQSLGSLCNNRYLGTMGDIGCFSLSPHKIISTGQGGLIVTNNDKLAGKIRRLKNFGRDSGGKDIHPEFGINAKFTDLQAVVGLEQLKKLPEKIQRKKDVFHRYRYLLRDVRELSFIDTNLIETAPWMVDVYGKNIKELAFHLDIHGIQTRFMYPPLYTQPYFKSGRNNMEMANGFGKTGLWLPSAVTDEEIDAICNCVKEFYDAGSNLSSGTGDKA